MKKLIVLFVIALLVDLMVSRENAAAMPVDVPVTYTADTCLSTKSNVFQNVDHVLLAAKSKKKYKYTRLGSGFNKAVLAGVNSERAFQGVPAVSLDGRKCAKALAHALAMAKTKKVFHAGLGYEAVTDSTSSGRSIGKRCANHAGDLAVNTELHTIGVGSVKAGGKQYTCVYG